MHDHVGDKAINCVIRGYRNVRQACAKTTRMADKFRKYIVVFLMAGAWVGIIGSAIPFLPLCFARESDDQTDEAIADLS